MHPASNSAYRETGVPAGPDVPENVVALCPNCYREANFGVDSKLMAEQLRIRIREKEKVFYSELR